MAEGEPPSRGVFDSIRELCDTVLALLQNRAELLAAELEEQKARLLRVFILAAVTVFLGNMAAVVVTATIVVLVGEHARLPALIALGVVYLAATAVTFLALRKELRSGPRPLDDTVSEIKKDREWLNLRK
jgi:uncharacterized membrane protein YqjE